MRLRSLSLALLSSTACADYESAFIEAEDVRLEMPADLGFRAEGPEGDVYRLIADTTNDVNGWVTATVEGVSGGIEYFNRWEPSAKEGEWRIYGPWTDTFGRNLNWVLEVSGDAEQTSYRVLAAPVSEWKRGEFEVLLAGDLVIEGEDLQLRSGGFMIDFDVLERHDGLKRWDLQANTYGGKIEVTFERDTTSLHKVIELDFQGFWADYADADVYESDDVYAYRRNADGSGTFDLSLTSTFESEEWSGPEVETMILESAWDPSEAGRARGSILEQDGSGDLSGGDMVIEECFDAQGTLTWRTINEPYAQELEGYVMGDVGSCVFEW